MAQTQAEAQAQAQEQAEAEAFEQEFQTLIQKPANTKRNIACFNFKTNNISKKARAKLEHTPYKALAREHFGAELKQAYYDMPRVRAKFEAIAQEYGIEIIA